MGRVIARMPRYHHVKFYLQTFIRLLDCIGLSEVCPRWPHIRVPNDACAPTRRGVHMHAYAATWPSERAAGEENMHLLYG